MRGIAKEQARDLLVHAFARLELLLRDLVSGDSDRMSISEVHTTRTWTIRTLEMHAYVAGLP
jgi:hypothetical protein